MQEAQRFFVLTQTDARWKEHLQAIKFLQQAVGLRGYAQVIQQLPSFLDQESQCGVSPWIEWMGRPHWLKCSRLHGDCQTTKFAREMCTLAVSEDCCRLLKAR